MRWTVILMFFCSACQSKPVASPAAESQPSQGKPTPALEAPIEVFFRIDQSPRPEVGDRLIANLDVQRCLSATPQPVSAVIVGRILFGGALKAQALKDGGAADECLTAALKAVSLGKGPKGRVKMELTTDPGRIPGAKGLILAPPPVKKFQ